MIQISTHNVRNLQTVRAKMLSKMEGASADVRSARLCMFPLHTLWPILLCIEF